MLEALIPAIPNVAAYFSSLAAGATEAGALMSGGMSAAGVMEAGASGGLTIGQMMAGVSSAAGASTGAAATGGAALAGEAAVATGAATAAGGGGAAAGGGMLAAAGPAAALAAAGIAGFAGGSYLAENVIDKETTLFGENEWGQKRSAFDWASDQGHGVDDWMGGGTLGTIAGAATSGVLSVGAGLVGLGAAGGHALFDWLAD